MQLEFVFGSEKSHFIPKDESLQLNLCSRVSGERNKIVVLDNLIEVIPFPDKIFFGNRELTGGIFIEPLDNNFAEKAFAIYKELLKKSENYNLCRAWNFIPDITGYLNGKSIYGMFNEGRSLAFQEYSMGEHQLKPPAATGVDIIGEKAVIVFIATKNKVEYFANPLQVDSFNYPAKYGNRPPCFSRATKTVINGKRVVFVSGTASIRGSESMFKGDYFRQLDTTIENIEIMLKETGIYREVSGLDLFNLEKIIYIKDISLFETVEKYIGEKYPLFKDGIYLQARICREELDVEICLCASEK